MNPQAIEELLRESIESAKLSSTQLEYTITQAAETQNITTVFTARFASGQTEPAIALNLFADALRERATLAGIDIIGPPSPRVVIHGLFDGDPFKVVVSLE